MQYLGGKYRIARHIESLVLRARRGRPYYAEPFLGGAATFSRSAPHFEHAYGYDVVPDLVLMWRAVLAGWEPPSDVPEELYAALRHAEPSPLRGFVGFGCSFGGKWFGGYGRQSIAGGRPVKEGEGTLAPGAARSVMRQAARMRNASVTLADYRELKIGPDVVVYCDPPYAGTTSYAATAPFDSAAFWRTAESWATDGAAVLVSEHEAPAGWVRVWEKPYAAYLRGDQAPDARTEAVFALPELAEQLAA